MARVKRGVTAHAKHKKILKKAKGYYGRRKNTIRIAKQAVEKAMHRRGGRAERENRPRRTACLLGTTRAANPLDRRGSTPKKDLDAVNDATYIREVVETDRMFREAGRWGEGVLGRATRPEQGILPRVFGAHPHVGPLQ